MTSSLAIAILSVVMRPVWLYVRCTGWLAQALRGKRRGRRILLVCHNPVAADHLRPIVALLANRPSYHLYVCNDHFPAQEITKSRIKQRVAAKYMPVLLCLLQHWDLVIYVNHAWGFGAWFAPFLHKVYINHGLYVGKINNSLGEDGVYGRHRTHRPHRGLMYERMLAASESERTAAINANPLLESVVRVAGSLMADAVLGRQVDRERIRRALDIDPGQPVIHVISTWGASSLAASSEPLRRELTRMGLIRNVLLSVHPRFDKFGGTSFTRGEMLGRWTDAGARVDVDNEYWQDFLVGADLAISDHSSLALYHILLGHPLVLTPVSDANYVAGSPFQRLANLLPTLDEVSQLTLVLAKAQAIRCDEFSKLAEHLVSYPGEAAAHHLQEIDQLVLQERWAASDHE